MKIRPFLFVLAVSSGLSFAPLHGQTISGQKLEIGTPSQAASGSAVGAVGTGNSVSSSNSLAIGTSNTLSSGSGQLALGDHNQISYSAYNAAIGSSNFVMGYNNAAIGVSNSFYGSSDSGDAYASVAVGAYNLVDYTASTMLVAGSNNVATGSSDGAALGRGLINQWSQAVIVGSYNDTAATGSLRFAVGNGANATARSNAFEVYADGTIKIAPQGDISAGEFAP